MVSMIYHLILYCEILHLLCIYILRTYLTSPSLQTMSFKSYLILTRTQKATQGAAKYCGSCRSKII